MVILSSLLIGYILGSIPTAYLLLKKTHGLDIRDNGSGNVGAMNSYEVTNSKKIGLIVFLFDAFKGWLSCLAAYHLIDKDFIYPMIALTSSVFAHCYSPWLKFKGGKGLATAAGGAFFISLPVLIVWGVIWLITFLISKNINVGNIFATLSSIIISFLIPGVMINYSFISPDNNFTFSLSVSLLMLIIFSKHKNDIKDYIKSLKTNKE